jgi:hypothetical protein
MLHWILYRFNTLIISKKKQVVSGLFMQRLPPLARFDVLLRVDFKLNDDDNNDDDDDDDDDDDRFLSSLCENKIRVLQSKAGEALKKGTVERVVRWRWFVVQ